MADGGSSSAHGVDVVRISHSCELASESIEDKRRVSMSGFSTTYV